MVKMFAHLWFIIYYIYYCSGFHDWVDITFMVDVYIYG